MTTKEAGASIRRDLALIFTTSFFTLLAYNMQTPTLSLFAVELGATLFQVGLISSVGAVVRLISRIPIGLLSDRFGRRPLFRFGVVCPVISLLLLYLSGSPSQIMGSLILNALGLTIAFTVAVAMAVETYHSPSGTGITIFALASSISGFIAPVICSALLITMPIRFTYLVGAIIGSIAIACSIALPSRRGVRSSFDIGKSLKNVIGERAIQLVSLLQISFTVSQVAIFTYFPLKASFEMGLSPSEITLLVSMYNLGMTLIRFPLPRIFERVSERKLIALAFLDYTLAMLAIPSAKSSIVLAVLICIAGIAHGIMFPAMSLYVSNSADKRDLGLANAVFGFAGDAVGIVAPIVLSFIIVLLGYDGLYYVVSVFDLAAALLMIILISRHRNGLKRLHV